MRLGCFAVARDFGVVVYICYLWLWFGGCCGFGLLMIVFFMFGGYLVVDVFGSLLC